MLDLIRGRLFRKLLFSAFLLITVTLLVLDSYLTRYTAGRETYHVKYRLQAQAELLSSELAKLPASQLISFAAQADRRAHARVTIIDPGGVVLADSEHDSETMENHANRPEVRDARQGSIGSSVRHSATLDRDFCYVAVPFTYSAQPGFVLRLAVPLSELDATVAAVRWRIIAASLIAAALAFFIAYLFSSRISRRIRRLQSFAGRLLQSPDTEVLAREADDEIGALTSSLNRMATRLRDLVDGLRIESARRQTRSRAPPPPRNDLALHEA